MRVFSSYVDNRSDFVIEAERLVWTLVNWAKVKPAAIFLQLAPGLSPDRLQIAEKLGVNLITTPRWPVFPGDPESVVYCNKVMQLAAEAIPKEADLTLLDCDVLATRPLKTAPYGVSGRIADVMAAPRESFEDLYHAAGLDMPRMVRPDTGPGLVPFGWFNGGVINISHEFRVDFSKSWPHWVNWILQSSTDPFIHRFIDEIAFCLAISETGAPASQLDRKMNFSVHLEKPFWKDRDPALIHYRGHFAKRGILRFVPRAQKLTLNYAPLSNRRITWVNQELKKFPSYGSEQ